MRNGETGLRARLAKSLKREEIDELARLVRGLDDNAAGRTLYRLMFDPDRRVAANAAWVFCHGGTAGDCRLGPKRDELMDEAMRTSDGTKRRLLLVLLLRQPFDKEKLRVDFLDFCLKCMGSLAESTSVKTLSIKLAYEQCRSYPDLLRELKAALELLEPDALPTGVRTVRRKTLACIEKVLKPAG